MDTSHDQNEETAVEFESGVSRKGKGCSNLCCMKGMISHKYKVFKKEKLKQIDMMMKLLIKLQDLQVLRMQVLSLVSHASGRGRMCHALKVDF